MPPVKPICKSSKSCNKLPLELKSGGKVWNAKEERPVGAEKGIAVGRETQVTRHVPSARGPVQQSGNIPLQCKGAHLMPRDGVNSPAVPIRRQIIERRGFRRAGNGQPVLFPSAVMQSRPRRDEKTASAHNCHPPEMEMSLPVMYPA